MKLKTVLLPCGVLVLALSLVLAGCANPGQTVELRGRIDGNMANVVSEALAAGHRDFTINSSAGGIVLVAELIAVQLTNADANLTVNGECFSACALLVLGVKEKYVTPDADIEIHGGWIPGRVDNSASAALTGAYMAAHGIPAPLAFGRGNGTNLYRLTLEDMAAADINRR